MKKLFTKVLAASILLASAGLFSAAIAADEVASAVAAPVAAASASVAVASTPEVAAPAAAPVAVVGEAATAVVAPAPTPNKGDTAWMMVATLLVILMTIPGLALFYGGLVRSKNMLSVLMQVFMIFAVIIVLWCIYGYSLAFTEGGRFIGSFDRVFLNGIWDPAKASFTTAATFSKGVVIPEFVYVVFQATFAAIGGMPIGIVANQPLALAGTLDIPASQKAARFVSFCDAFNIPIVTLVDTPGFYPGKDLEWRGMIRHGAQLVFAYGRATVPRICVILRKSYGGAYIVMDSKTMGNDLCIAWPWAELAVMGAGQAAAILQRRASPEERATFESDYAERLLNPYIAAERGYIDGVIEPAETRAVIAGALVTLQDKREALVSRPHDNTPL